ncbi:hypothetical protein CDAR_437451 [Caerostris darwini]|uniref:Uncharacterized protein n=1 Tax=Caerostris darwini TaxID=1538125 RepID=A0AAV4NVY0_9ARAC|nr:hypothetical protein CDAR_437451 [Caerostris darwini]
MSVFTDFNKRYPQILPCHSGLLVERNPPQRNERPIIILSHRNHCSKSLLVEQGRRPVEKRTIDHSSPTVVVTLKIPLCKIYVGGKILNFNYHGINVFSERHGISRFTTIGSASIWLKAASHLRFIGKISSSRVGELGRFQLRGPSVPSTSQRKIYGDFRRLHRTPTPLRCNHEQCRFCWT